jgi:hypothetical protein
MDNLKKDESFLFEKMYYLKGWRTEVYAFRGFIGKNKVQ